ncbi:phage portal protein [Eggerthella lenta]|uniref:phage portal protein n=1 Tax=Eggerthella lenta TaxID=84112 RepID=UPI0022DF5496|nr:phage portal protein [Eggerthella lenta]
MTYYDIPHAIAVKGLSEDELADLNALLSVWWRKRERNVIRERYYNAHNRLKDLGISIPPPLKRIETVVGWPEKAVDYIADRAVLEGFTFGGVDESEELNAVMDENDFLSTYSQAVTDALVSSCAFITVTRGKGGEPPAIVSAHSARDSAALWDDRLKRIRCGLAVAEFERDREGRIKGPLLMNMFTSSHVLCLRKARNGRYVLESRLEHSQGRPLMEAIRYKPKIGRPFGKSRVSRTVMSITDSAVREALRSEVSAEFFTAPQKYILGAEDSIFDEKGKWEQYIGNWIALTKDEDGEVPKIGQFSQGSMQPHTEYMRSLAARLSGETGVPISSLGVIHDNPSSAEAIYAAKEDAVIDAAKFNRDNRAALRRIALLMLAVSRGVSVSDLDDGERTVQPRFMNPSMPSIVSQSDAMVKQISAIPWIGESRVALEQLGYEDSQIMRLMSDKRKVEGRALMRSQQERPDAAASAT